MPIRSLVFESVESRVLLAVDLAIQIDEYMLDDEAAGGQVERTIRVFNNGDEDAIDAIVHSELTSQLDNPQWIRRDAYAQLLPTSPQIEIPSPVRNRPPSVPFGDINADGFTDYFETSFREATIHLGSPILDQIAAPTLTQIQNFGSGSVPLPFSIIAAVDVGDVNDDGLADFLFDTRLILGSAGIGPGNAPNIIEIDTGFTTMGYSDFYNPRYADDFNGDGINDLMFVMDGPSCSGSCTATEKDEAFVDAGVAIVLGHANIGLAEKIEAHTEGLRYPFIVPYTARLDAVSRDINQDGLSDVVISTHDHTVVILGGTEMASIDLQDVDDSKFDGENGFLVSSNAVSSNEFELSDRPLAGEGNLADKLTVPAGRGVIYTVTGELKANAAPSISSVVFPSPQQADAQPSDNATPRSSAVQLELELSTVYSAPVDGGPFEIQVIVENTGDQPARSVSIHETITQYLQDAEWTLRSTNLFPSNIDGRTPGFGPGTNGLKLRPDFQGLTQSSLDATDLYMRTTGTFGLIAGGVGDANGDGFDDFFISQSVPSSPRIWAVDVFYGGPEFGNDNTFETITESSRVPITSDFSVELPRNNTATLSLHPVESRAIGLQPSVQLSRGSTDFNGDGIDDVITYTDTDTELRIELSGSHSEDDVFALSLGDEVLTELGEVSEWNRIAVGDLNGDGIDDLAVSSDGVSVYFGGRNFGRDVAFTVTGSAPQFLFPLSVASGFDVNADGIDDLLIVDPFSRWRVDSTLHRAFIIFGRRATSLAGSGSVDATFKMEPKERLTLTISGTVLSAAELGSGTVSIITAQDQTNLTPHAGSASMAISEPIADLDDDGVVGFSDFLILSSSYSKSDATEREGDIDGDGRVSFADFLILHAELAERADA